MIPQESNISLSESVVLWKKKWHADSYTNHPVMHFASTSEKDVLAVCLSVSITQAWRINALLFALQSLSSER
jgi:hypothetical protein